MLRERVIQKASELFSLYGIKNVSMDDLSSSLGVSKRTIYENFNNKEDILHRCLYVHQESRNRRIVEIMKESENVVVGFLQIIKEYRFKKLPTMLFWDDIYKYYPRVYQFIQDDLEKCNIYLKRLLSEGIRENYFRDNLQLDEFKFTLNTALLVMMRDSSDTILSIMVNMLRGISADKGIEIVDRYIANLPCSNN